MFVTYILIALLMYRPAYAIDINMSLCLTELGEGWEPAVLESQEEHDFVRQAQESLSNHQAYFIGGSTSFSDRPDELTPQFDPIEYLHYSPDQVAGNFILSNELV